MPPSSVLDDGTVEQFRTMMRDSLVEGGPMARSYLRFLVERIEVRRNPGRRPRGSH